MNLNRFNAKLTGQEMIDKLQNENKYLTSKDCSDFLSDYFCILLGRCRRSFLTSRDL